MEEKIKKIYEVIANKELSFGCIYTPDIWRLYGKVIEGENKRFYVHNWETPCHVNIIGHPVMIGDVLDWLQNNGIDFKAYKDVPRWKTYTSPTDMIRMLWQKKRLPIEDQPQECIGYIHWLIQED